MCSLTFIFCWGHVCGNLYFINYSNQWLSQQNLHGNMFSMKKLFFYLVDEWNCTLLMGYSGDFLSYPNWLYCRNHRPLLIRVCYFASPNSELSLWNRPVKMMPKPRFKYTRAFQCHDVRGRQTCRSNGQSKNGLCRALVLGYCAGARASFQSFHLTSWTAWNQRGTKSTVQRVNPCFPLKSVFYCCQWRFSLWKIRWGPKL